MRGTFAIVLIVATTGLVFAQRAKEPERRYAVNPRVKAYPQTTPKEALRSAIAAIEDKDYPYLVAHLLDPKFVDDAVNERAKLFEGGAELELAQLRDFQRANSDRFAPEDRVPLDPKAFRAAAALKAHDYAFKQLVKDIKQKLANDPQVVKDFRHILSSGSFAVTDPTAAATHPAVKGRTLYFNKLEDRWFLENRQAEEKKAP